MLIWRRNVAQRLINVETTLCTSKLKFTTLNNVESTFSISKLVLTTLDNVETTLSFSKKTFTTLGNIETTLWIWPFEKKIKSRFKNKIIFLSFKEYAGLKIFFILFSILRGLCKRRFAGRKVLKTWNILNYKNYIWTISLCKMLTSF